MTHRTLVTGGAGFIGSHLVERLLAAGEQVVVLDNLSSGKRENLPPQAELVVGDITDAALVGDLVQRADSVCHLAALVSVQECIRDWDLGHRVNLGATIGLFRAAADARPGGIPVVYASSAAVYGDRSGSDCAEADPPAPISPYGADKLGCEHQARAMAEIHRLPSVGLRFFNVYGPRQDPRSPYAGVISKFCANRLADSPHTVFGDGRQSRDFIYVADIVEGLVRARAHARDQGGASVFNLCTGAGTTLTGLAAEIDSVAGRGTTPIQHAEPRSGDIRMSLGNPSLAARELGFHARTDIRTGLGMLWASLAGAECA
ncbi:NAD-dependent epimerase/dehydratase family protein [Paracoccus sp. DMF-8]|uniref:NAD-dependent epimerase/dehydratase family protein n=1 Tax=Paracoccus sp. DMF-8 TaxID=3019445 RepID=UPI0023E7B9CF|nr:NAD-dependent epimerase/dehydratase family protein [Paracoccus sp. DMF-8]MDF3604984.1 NAD-dependent epimerase/dehydratase family protein [Paracoccus sp. DMF-8]